MFEKILISRCFLGENVRYNSETIPLNHPLLTLWQQQNRVIAICPEVSGGLSVPREPAEQQSNSDEIITISGINVSAQFNFGAKQALILCQQHNIQFALLSARSPSCGNEKIYNGKFNGQLIDGQGVTAALLTQHGIHVFNQFQLEELEKALKA